MSEYRIITVANKKPVQDYYTFDEFFKSAKETVSVLGWQSAEYGGLGSKPRMLYMAIKDGHIPEKYILFCDCFDLVFAESPSVLFEKYKEFNSPFVISAEKNAFPADLRDDYDKLDSGRSPYKYLNSGMIVAETEAMLTVLEAMDAKNIPNDYWSEEKKCMINPNDQEYYQHLFLKQPVQMTLDYNQILCNTLHSVQLNDLDFTGENILNKETNTYPCAFHLNGSAKTDGLREPILKHLNLI